VWKSQFLGMQHQARTQGPDLGWGVQRVTQHRMANALQVHTQLVRAARDGLQFKQGGGFGALQCAPAAAAGFAVWVDDVDRATLPVQQYRPVNAAPTLRIGLDLRLGLQGLSRDNGQVALVDLTGFKQPTEAALRFDAARHEQEARCVLVQTVHHQCFGVSCLHAR
jgi:hypothetical protein